MRTNAMQLLQENYHQVEQEISFSECVKTESENDPNFFRYLFEEDFDEDFDRSLSKEQRAEWDQFLNDIEEDIEKYLLHNEPYAYYTYNNKLVVIIDGETVELTKANYKSLSPNDVQPCYIDCYTNDITYGATIDKMEVINFENEQKLIETWEILDIALGNQITQKCGIITDSHYAWTSELTIMIDKVHNAIQNDGDTIDQLSVLQEEWEITLNRELEGVSADIKAYAVVYSFDDIFNHIIHLSK